MAFLKNPLASTKFIVFNLISLKYCLASTLENTLLWVFIFLSFSFLKFYNTFIYISSNLHSTAQACLQLSTFFGFFCSTNARTISTPAVCCSWSSALPPGGPTFCWVPKFDHKERSAKALPRSRNRRARYPKFESLWISESCTYQCRLCLQRDALW